MSQAPAQAHRLESFWTAALDDLRSHAQVKELRIRGSVAAVEIDVPGGYLAEAGGAMRKACLEQGVLLRPLGSVLYALPPYCTSTTSLDRIVAAMKAALAAY
jgi:adenosylmethionine-8-amino-7-oxononanoate aminotransferase